MKTSRNEKDGKHNYHSVLCPKAKGIGDVCNCESKLAWHQLTDAQRAFATKVFRQSPATSANFLYAAEDDRVTARVSIAETAIEDEDDQ
jgi:hypothetical protein